MGWNVLNEEDNLGSLARTHIMDSPLAEVAGILGDAAGANPATGAYRYYVSDHLGSTRGLYDGGKSALGGYEYSPYGKLYANSGNVALEGLAAAFTGKPWDAAAQMYYFPYRWHSPSAARWLTRDPLGMVDGPNVYGYCGLCPADRVDQMGLDWGHVVKKTLLHIFIPIFGLVDSVRFFRCLLQAYELGDAEQGYNRKHCVAGCELQKCMRGTILPQAVWQLNVYYELLWWGSKHWDAEDVRRDNWAAEYGAVEAWDDPCVDCGKACSVWP